MDIVFKEVGTLIVNFLDRFGFAVLVSLFFMYRDIRYMDKLISLNTTINISLEKILEHIRGQND